MTFETPSPDGSPTIVAPEGTDTHLNVSDAARILSSARRAKREAASAEVTPAAEPEESAPEADDAPQEIEPSVETEAQHDPEPEEATSIEPPRSWSREARERWNQLDPEVQEYLLERDSQDSAAIRKAQNEAAEQRKAADAELQAAQQQREQYEQALAYHLQALQSTHGSEFGDIQSPADEARVAREDPLRYSQYLAHVRQAELIQRQHQALYQQRQQEYGMNWQSQTAKEDQLFAERFPDATDPVKGPEIRAEALKHLKALFTDEELGAAYTRPNAISLRDHRLQTIIAEWSQYKTREAKAKKATPKPVRQVVRPGVASGKNSEMESRTTALEQKLDKTGNWKDAAKLYMQRRSKP
jgi:hypothetical protein